MTVTNSTHNPDLRSWVPAANDPASDFPIQNLPFGVFRRTSGSSGHRIGVAIGDQILDLTICRERGIFRGELSVLGDASTEPTLNHLMSFDEKLLSLFRKRMNDLLVAHANEKAVVAECLVPMSETTMVLPADVGDYTDFYASVFHATNVGSLFRPDNPLLPNYKYIPIGYHGRSSSIVVSGTPVRRPSGQTRAGDDVPPVFGPSRRLDYELEVGCFIGRGNVLGEPVSITNAEKIIFGFCLVNDWSARDIQKWEYQPLGPFLGKNFATTISPWVVTLEALAPFRNPAFPRPPVDPQPLEYLSAEPDQTSGGIDLDLEVFIETEKMRADQIPPARVSRGNLTDLYWTFGQMLAHHTSNGCNMRPGDLVASGTVSGKEEGSQGCLLEMTNGGADPFLLPNGELRRFLEDGDEVILKGTCRRPGFRAIGFGECRGRLVR